MTREPNKYEGIIFVPGRVGEEFAVTIPDGKRTRTIVWESNLERAVVYRKGYLERNLAQPSADAPETTATEGEYETSSQD